MAKSYDSIIKGFTSTIDKLEKLALANGDKEAAKTQQIKDLKAECIALAEESEKCKVTADKLRELVS